MPTLSFHRLLIITITVLVVLIAPVSTQDAETTDEPTIVGATDTPTRTPVPPSTVIPSATFSPSPMQTFQPTATLSPTVLPLQAISPTVSVSVSSTYTITPTVTATSTITGTPDAEAIDELAPVSSTATEVPTTTLSPTMLMSVSATEPAVVITPTSLSGTITPVSPTVTQVSPTLTSVSTTIAPTSMPTISGTLTMTPVSATLQPTATVGGMALRYIQGVASYQNHITDDSGILLQVFTDDLTLVSEATTNAQGIYSIAVPMEGEYWLVVSAREHRTERVYINEEGNPDNIILMAGDLNNDDCINFDDMYLILDPVNAKTNVHDLNADGENSLSDVAMLAGNLNSECELETAVTATPVATAPVDPESAEATAEIIVTPTLMTSVSLTLTETPVLLPEITDQPQP